LQSFIGHQNTTINVFASGMLFTGVPATEILRFYSIFLPNMVQEFRLSILQYIWITQQYTVYFTNFVLLKLKYIYELKIHLLEHIKIIGNHVLNEWDINE